MKANQRKQPARRTHAVEPAIVNCLSAPLVNPAQQLSRLRVGSGLPKTQSLLNKEVASPNGRPKPLYQSRVRRDYPLLTTRQFETADSSLPTGRAGILASQCVVLIDVPERAIVGGIDSHVRVIAPARVGGPLYPRAVDDRAFAQSHLT